MGINQFTIFSDQQFKAKYLAQIFTDQNDKQIQIIDIQDGDIKIQQNKQNQNVFSQLQNQKQLKADIDWTSKGKVTPVKNQGACGACWAFSSNAVAQSWALIKNKGTYDLSQQQLMDCSSSYGNKGCNGGLPSWALKYTLNNGAATQRQYPYKAAVGSCLRNGGTFKIPSTNSASGCKGILSAINYRPLSVLVDATNWSRYSSGVFNNCASRINHAVLLVGIVSNNWKIKNSWGYGWGQQGYIRLLKGNTCAICNMPAVFVE